MERFAPLCWSVYQDIVIRNIKKSQWEDDLDPSPSHASGGAAWRTSWNGEIKNSMYLVGANYDVRNRKKFGKEDCSDVVEDFVLFQNFNLS